MRRLFRSPLFLALIGLALWSVLAWLGARKLIVRKDLPRADSLVVLAGSATYEERTSLAASLFRAGRAPRVILTDDYQQAGWSQPDQRNPFYVELAARKLQSLGVPASQIDVLSPAGSGTRYEAESIRQFADQKQIKSLLIVTSSYHSRRALWIMETAFAGTNVQIGLEPVPTGIQTPPPSRWWIHRRGWLLVPTEYVKMVKECVL